MNDKTDMRYWFPRIEKRGLFVPNTIFVTMNSVARDCALRIIGCEKTSKEEKTEFFNFVNKIALAISKIGTPCFLRTGYTSAKHSWNNSCYIDKNPLTHSRDMSTSFDFYLVRHILNIVTYSITVSSRCLPFDAWAIRELLPTSSAFKAFHGMPITCEFRVFAKNGKLICVHPYWPVDALENHVDESKWTNWRHTLREYHAVDSKDAVELALEASKCVPGDAWSVDMLWTRLGWYITDMALAHESYHWSGCKKDINQFE